VKTGRSRSMYLLIRRVIKHSVAITEAYHFCQNVQNNIQHPVVKVNSICRGNYWGSSLCISKQQINY
jgi:predicted DNA-binding protein